MEQLFLCCAERVPTSRSAPADPAGSPWTCPVLSRGAVAASGRGSWALAHPPRGSASPPTVLTRKQWHPRQSLLCTDSSAVCASVSVPGAVMAVHFPSLG